jgi:hypothetical protein
MIDFEAQWLMLARSLEKGRASGSIGPRLFTTPHQKSTQLINTLLVVSKI